MMMIMIMVNKMVTMKIYHVSRNEHIDYDTYSEFVIVARNEYEARYTNPCGFEWDIAKGHWEDEDNPDYSSWTSPDKVKVVCIGVADKSYTSKKIICASFREG